LDIETFRIPLINTQLVGFEIDEFHLATARNFEEKISSKTESLSKKSEKRISERYSNPKSNETTKPIF